MAFISDVWTPGLVQTGPPPWSNNDQFDMSQKRVLWAPNVATMKAIASHPNNLFLDLLGEFDLLDGLLQGRFIALSPDRSTYPFDGYNETTGGYVIYSNDGQTMWRKFT